MRHSYLPFKWNLEFYKTSYPSKYGKSNQVNFLFMLISSKNKMSDICPTTLNCTFLMPLFNPVVNIPHNINGGFYFLRRKKKKMELYKKKICSFIVENNFILSGLAKFLNFHIYIVKSQFL